MIITEVGRRPEGLEQVRDHDLARTYYYVRGVQIGWVDDVQIVMDDDAVIDWNEVRTALESGPRIPGTSIGPRSSPGSPPPRAPR